MENIVLISGESNEPLARDISKHLNIPLTPVLLDKFSSGESRVEIVRSVRNKKVYIIQSGYTFEPDTLSPNDYLMQTIMLTDACFRASAREIVLVLPCLAYSEESSEDESIDPDEFEGENELQNWIKESFFPGIVPYPQLELFYKLKDHDKSTTTATTSSKSSIIVHSNPFRLVASLLQCSGAKHLLTFQLPRPQLVGFFDIPVDEVPLTPVLASFLDSPTPKEYVLAVSDISLAKSVGQVAKDLQRQFVILQKLPNESEFYFIGNDCSNRNILLIDEIGNRAIEAAHFFKHSKSAASITLLIIHLTDFVSDFFDCDAFDQILIANSNRIPKNIHSKVECIDISLHLAEAIKHLNANY